MNFRSVSLCCNCHKVRYNVAVAKIVNMTTLPEMCSECGVDARVYDAKQKRIHSSWLKPLTWFGPEWETIDK